VRGGLPAAPEGPVQARIFPLDNARICCGRPEFPGPFLEGGCRLAEVLAQGRPPLGTGMQNAKAQLETPELFAWTTARSFLPARPRRPIPRRQAEEASWRLALENVDFSYGDEPLFSGFSFESGTLRNPRGPWGRLAAAIRPCSTCWPHQGAAGRTDEPGG
jgi:hypothetical protein